MEKSWHGASGRESITWRRDTPRGIEAAAKKKTPDRTDFVHNWERRYVMKAAKRFQKRKAGF